MTGVTGLITSAVFRNGLATTSVATPATALTGVTTALVAKLNGLVIMLPQPLDNKTHTTIKTGAKTYLLIQLTSSNQLCFANIIHKKFSNF